YQRAIRGFDPAIVEAYRRLSGRVHEAGALVLAQLGHAGMQGTGHIDKQPLWAPSAVANPATLEMPKVMEPEDVAAVIEGLGLAVELSEHVDYVSVVAGSIYSVEETRAGLHRPPGYLLDLAASVRARLGGTPVFASGSLVDAAQASAAIAVGQADACEMTRAL